MRTSSIFLVSLVVLAMSCAGPQRIPSNNWTTVAEKTIEATVLIESQFEFTNPLTGEVQTAKAVGTGVILSENGYLVTNAHVVSSDDGYSLANMITVRFKDGRVFMAENVFSFPKNDLAIIKIAARNLDFLKIRLGRVIVGERCLATGMPIPYTWSVSEGIISDSDFVPYNESREEDIHHIVSTAQIHAGNSGGSLVDVNGDIIGINQAIYVRKDSYAIVIGVETMLYVLDTVSGILGKKIYSLSK